MPPCFLGLDIAKDHIDVSVRPTGEHWQAPQTDAHAGHPRHIAGDPACKIIDLELRDRLRARLSRQEARPCRLDPAGKWRNQAQSCDDDSAHSRLYA